MNTTRSGAWVGALTFALLLAGATPALAQQGTVAGRVTGDGENDTVEFVWRSACSGVTGGAGAGVAAAPGPGGVAGAGAADGVVPAAAGLGGLRWSRVNVSEPVFRPRILASWIFGIRRMCGVSMMMISV